MTDPVGCASAHQAASHDGALKRTLLQLDGVHTHIGAYHILHGVDFEVPTGEVTMLLGRNGAGKTTTLRTIMGLWVASRGHVLFDGQPINGEKLKRSTPDVSPAERR